VAACWRAAEVNVYDFPDKAVGKAIPYGIYDVQANEGWVGVGGDHDTAAFAVETIRRWYRCVGQPTYPGASRLLICADGGGSNASRSRLWKTELAGLAAETGLEITVCHLPPGTSKWNKIEHRLFSHVSMNWRGRPLVSHEVVVELIGATTTRTGLKVRSRARPRALSDQDQGERRRPGRRPAAQARVPRGLELHHRKGMTNHDSPSPKTVPPL